jgi:hypothetical protein
LAVDIHVPGDFPDIQSAIFSAEAGDVIILAQMTHSGSGNRDLDFSGMAITLRSEDPNDPAVVAATVIDCEGTDLDPHRGVIIEDGEGPDSILEGITIINGNESIGGGVFCKDSSPTIRNCVIDTNTANSGGGMYFDNSNAVIHDCILRGNMANLAGGGAYGVNSDLTFLRCQFLSNHAVAFFSDGGGFYCINNMMAVFTDCQFVGNSCGQFGGGLFCSTASDVWLINGLMLGNQAASSGGGCYNNGSVLNLLNFTVSGNRCMFEDGGGLKGFNMAEIFVTNSILWANQSDIDEGNQIGVRFESEITLSFSSVAQLQDTELFVDLDSFLFLDPPDNSSNLQSDPLFVAEGMLDDNGTIDVLSDDTWIDGDYHLRPVSPSRNSGDTAAIAGVETDLDGLPRVISGAVDMGPYELQIMDGPDLVGLFGAFDPDLPLLPGEKGAIPFTIQNIGNAATDKAFRIRIAGYASLDETLDEGTDILIGELLKQSVSLKPGDTKSYKLKTVLPATLPPGDYYALIHIDADNAMPEADDSTVSNLVVSDTCYPLVWQFGNVVGRGRNLRLTVEDPASQPVTFRLGGDGWGQVQPDFSELTLQDTTAKSALTVSTKGRGTFTTMNVIRVMGGGDLKSITGKTLDLENGALALADSFVGKIQLRHLTHCNVEIGDPISEKSAVTLTLAEVTGVNITSQSPFKSITVTDWINAMGSGGIADLIEAPWISKLTAKGNKRAEPDPIPGDFEASLMLTGDNNATVLLGNAKIPGAIRNAFWEIDGGLGTVKAACLDNALIFVGVDGSITDIDGFNGVPADFTGNQFEVKSVSLTCLDGGFFINDSVLAAEIINSLKFSDTPQNSSGLIEFLELNKATNLPAEQPGTMTITDADG